MEFNKLIELGMKPAEALKLRAGFYAKIEELAQAVTLKKGGSLSVGGGRYYGYFTHEQVTEAVRELSTKIGLSFAAEVLEFNENSFQVEKDRNGKISVQKWVRSVVTLQIRVTDTKTGYQEVFKFAGAEQDAGGKSMQQAVTQAYKYFMFKFLKITEKETDGDTNLRPIEGVKQTTQDTNPAAIIAALKKVTTKEGLKNLWGATSKANRARPEIIEAFKAANIY